MAHKIFELPESLKSTYKVKTVLEKKLASTFYQVMVVDAGRWATIEVFGEHYANREAAIEIHMSLNHPNIVRTMKLYKDGLKYCLLQEFCPNQTLEDLRLRQKGKKFSEEEARSYLLQMINALKYLHSRNIVHRHLKTTNFFLDGSMTLKLACFANATRIDPDYEQNSRFSVTEGVTAPEVFRNKRCSSKADIWSLGSILYSLLVGENMHQNEESIWEDGVLFPAGSDLSVHARDLIRGLLQLDPDERLSLDEILKHKFLERPVPRDSKVLPLKKEREDDSLNTTFVARNWKTKLVINKECCICLDKFPVNSLICSGNCTHLPICCPQCLKQHITVIIKSAEFPIKCPVTECSSEISQQDVSKLLGRSYTELYLDLSLNSYMNSHANEIIHCPTPDCRYFMIGSDKIGSMSCEICKKDFCLRCKKESHEGRTCNYQNEENDRLFKQYAETSRFQQCSCGFWIERTAGCNHMVCKCKAQFCYKCGMKWGSCFCL